MSLIIGYNLKGCLCSIGVGFPFREIGVDNGMSEAPDGLLDNFDDGGRGVLVPLDDVFVLKIKNKKITNFIQFFYIFHFYFNI